MIEFQAWPKTPRLFRDSVITEKIDGINAAIGIRPYDDSLRGVDNATLAVVQDDMYLVYAQSRKRLITPDKANDNAGFAAWVYQYAETLVNDLGLGLHFGEWWGKGIQRNYGMTDRYFSLFNTEKWSDIDFATPNLRAVPVIARGIFSTYLVNTALDALNIRGSFAAPGFKPAEGIVVYHTASSQVFKALLENDDKPKGLVA